MNMDENKLMKNYVKKTVKSFLGDKNAMEKLRRESEKPDEDELEIISVSPLRENKTEPESEGKLIIVPLLEDIYYILSLYHSGVKLTNAEEDIIKNNRLKDRNEFIENFREYLPGVPDAQIPKAVAWVMGNYLKFMANLERKAMQVILAERIGALADVRHDGLPLPPYPSQDLLYFRNEYKKGKITHSEARREVIEHLNLLIEAAEMDFERERKEFYEVINRAFSEITNIGDDSSIRDALAKNVGKFISEKYKTARELSGFYDKPKNVEVEKREFPFMPAVLEIIIKTGNLTGDYEVSPLIKKLEFSMINLNNATQFGVEDAMNAYRHQVLIYFYGKAKKEF